MLDEDLIAVSGCMLDKRKSVRVILDVTSAMDEIG